MDRPSGTVTFLFTDIVDSTGLWDRHPAAMEEALGRHNELLLGVFARYNGYVFTAAGDGYCVAFADPMDAIRAAGEGHEVLRASTWGETGRLQVRVAIHTGLVEEQDGDYFGPPLNRTARILSVTRGDEILISRTSADLIRHHLPEGLGFADLGERRLRGLSLPEHIYRLEAGIRPARPRRRVVIWASLAAAGILVVATTVWWVVSRDAGSAMDTPTTTHPFPTTTDSSTSTTTGNGRLVGRVAWGPLSPGGMLVPPLATDDAVYVGGEQGLLAAYDLQDGSLRWQPFDAMGPISHAPVESDRILFFSVPADNLVYGIRSSNGEQVFRCSFGFLAPGPPAVDAGVVYVVAGDSPAISARDFRAAEPCNPIDENGFGIPVIGTSPVRPLIGGDALIVVDAAGGLHLFRLSDLTGIIGRIDTVRDLNKDVYEAWGIAATAVLERSLGQFGTAKEYWIFVSQWQQRTETEWYVHRIQATGDPASVLTMATGGIAVVGRDRVFVADVAQEYLLSLDHEFAEVSRIATGPLALPPVIDEAARRVYALAESGILYAIDTETLAIEWTYPTEGGVSSLAAADGYVILVVGETALFAITGPVD